MMQLDISSYSKEQLEKVLIVLVEEYEQNCNVQLVALQKIRELRIAIDQIKKELEK